METTEGDTKSLTDAEYKERVKMSDMQAVWYHKSIAEFWQKNRASFAGEVKSSEVVRLTRRYIKGEVLDVGAGSGALINLLPDAIGVDIEPRHQRIVRGTITELPFVDNLFGTVFAMDTLEHLPDDTLIRGMSEVARVLKQSGKFIVLVPYREQLAEGMVQCPCCQTVFHRWGHLRQFDRGSLVELLDDSGFKVVRVQVLPMALMAEHWLIRYFWRLFVRVGFIRANDLLVVAEKC